MCTAQHHAFTELSVRKLFVLEGFCSVEYIAQSLFDEAASLASALSWFALGPLLIVQYAFLRLAATELWSVRPPPVPTTG